MKKKKILIPERIFQSDFSPLTGFFDYHLKGRDIDIPLEKIQGLGVNLIRKNQKDVDKEQENHIDVNTIVFSSSNKKKSVKNLAWCLRCLVSHPENIEMVNVDNKTCYRLRCYKKENNKNKYYVTMVGLVDCEIWTVFIKKLMDIIKENEKNYETNN